MFHIEYEALEVVIANLGFEDSHVETGIINLKTTTMSILLPMDISHQVADPPISPLPF
ncbi:hypothetical protein DSLASN_08760 [Desulfoluna limicola]|uniref:Uncharacterized protein n=1 Tax=Desulfoluna limicola TaxID=2810562 RepID=A0ABM7PDJ4_9BACT|nr:hypothetical protein DSLASN_08760 [Desulfoluna limicola]